MLFFSPLKLARVGLFTSRKGYPTRFKIKLEVLSGKQVKLTKTGKYYHRIQKIPYIVHGFLIWLRNWIIPFKLSRLLVTHDEGKLSRVSELSLAERLQGR